MLYLLALLPIALVLILMIVWRWGAHYVGLAGWGTGVVVAAAVFGLTPEIFWVSQFKGMLLSLFVLAVMWPALFLFQWLDAKGGIRSMATAIESAIPEPGMCTVLMAWALSGLLEGLAGFGLPIAIVAPMLVALGTRPLPAVAAVAVGHAWSVTFGDMGVIIQTLAAVVNIEARLLVPWSAVLLGVACLACGLSTALLLRQQRHWWKIVLLAVPMSLTQYGLAHVGLMPLAGFGAGLTGLLTYTALARTWLLVARKPDLPQPQPSTTQPGLAAAYACYGGVIALMSLVTLVPVVSEHAQALTWRTSFPELPTRTGFVMPPSTGPAIKPWVHPGTLIAMVVIAAVLVEFRRRPPDAVTEFRHALRATWNSGAVTSLGVFLMVGLSTVMEHCGMSLLLAKGASHCFGALYPLAAPAVGVLGAFATGSNNNSNIMFGALQKNVALLLNISPTLLVAAQTAGGSLGSLLAPAKLVVGCSTVGLTGQEGLVLRRTLPCGIIIALALGVMTLLFARIAG